MKLTILLLNLFFGLLPQQSTFTLIGSVRDQSGQAVSGVRLTVIDENYQIVQSSFVDASGRFRVSGLRMGKYMVRIETPGTPYEEQSQQLELQSLRRMGGDETIPLEFRLKSKKGDEPATRGGSVFAQDIPKAARAEFNRGVNQLKSNKSEAAIASFKKAIDILPNYFDALELLGIEYAKSGQFESAVQTLTQAFKTNSRSARTMYGLGVAHLNLHQHAEAIEWLGKAAQLELNNANTQMMLGLAYGNGNVLDKSEAAFRKALQLGGEAAAEAHFYLAGLLNKQGQIREARRELESFLKESKNVKDPTQIKAMIEKLKERENAAPAQTSNVSATTPSRSENQIPAAPATKAQTLDPIAAAGNAQSGPAPTATELSSSSPENDPLPLKPLPPLPSEIVELLHQSEATGGTMHKRLFDYTYLLKKTRRVLDAHGNPANVEEQIFEAFPIRGEHVLIKLSANGIPSRTLADDRKRAAKQLEEAEQRQSNDAPGESARTIENLDYVSAGVSGVYGRKPGYVSINVSAFLRACEFFSPREEMISDRAMLALDFRRRAGVALPHNQAYISKLVGTIWIDKRDKLITRLEAWPATQAAFDLLQSTAPRENAALIYQQARQANGAWFPTMIRMNAGGRADLFDGLNWDVLFEFSNYQRFDTNASDAIINPANKNPQR